MPITELGQRMDRTVLRFYNNTISLGDALEELRSALDKLLLGASSLGSARAGSGADAELELREFAESAQRLLGFMSDRYYTLEEAVLGYFAPPTPKEGTDGKG